MSCTAVQYTILYCTCIPDEHATHAARSSATAATGPIGRGLPCRWRFMDAWCMDACMVGQLESGRWKVAVGVAVVSPSS